MLEYEWDDDKRALNIAKHRIDFTAAGKFDWDDAVISIDHRDDHGELREIAIGFIGVRLHLMVFTRRGTAIRIISLRRARNTEKMTYVQARG